jgi:hypothetical protein
MIPVMLVSGLTRKATVLASAPVIRAMLRAPA